MKGVFFSACPHCRQLLGFLENHNVPFNGRDVTVSERINEEQLAQWIERSLIALAERHGFYEYSDPETGKGSGEKDFSWTAALVIALIDDRLKVQERELAVRLSTERTSAILEAPIRCESIQRVGACQK